MTNQLNKTAAFFLFILVFFASTCSITTSANEKAKSTAHLNYQYLFNAAVQGSSEVVSQGLSDGNVILNHVERTKLSIMLNILNEDTDKAETQLTKFTKDNLNNANALNFAATMWKKLSKKMGFFSYMKTYKKGLHAHINAFKAEPENDNYRSLAGSAYTMLDSDNKEIQRSLLDGFQIKNEGFHLVALMDMAQNDGDEKAMLKYAEMAFSSTTTNSILLEQIGQTFWSGGDVSRAQQAFLKACLSPAPNDIFRYLWQDSCHLAGHLALNETHNYQQGKQALNRLLSINQLDTELNREIKELSQELELKLK